VTLDPIETSAGGTAATPPPWKRAALALALAVVGGLLMALPVRDPGLHLLSWVATAPGAILACHPRLRRHGAWPYLLMLAVQWYVTTTWIRGQGPLAFAVTPLFYFPLAWPAFFLARRLAERWPAMPTAVIWPVVYTGVDWLRMRLSPGELGLCVIAHAQVEAPITIQVADLGGVHAVTFVLGAAGGFLADAVAAATPDGAASRRRARWSAAVAASLVVATLAYGLVRDTRAHESPGPVVHVLQAGLPHGEDRETMRRIYELQVVQTLSTVAPGDVDAVLWPENSVMAYLVFKGEGLHPYFAPDLVALAQRLRAPVLVDARSVDQATQREWRTAVLVQPDGAVQTYDKVRLLPWAEYVPLGRVVGLLGDGAVAWWQGLIASVMGFVPAGTPGDLEQLRPFALRLRDGRIVRVGTPVCYEVATPRVVLRWQRLGAELLVNPTAEGKLGDGIHVQSLAAAIFRAVEGRTPVVRAGNDGISCVIDANGRVRETLRGRATGSPINEPGVLRAVVMLDGRHGRTLAVRWGEWLPQLAVALLAVAWVEARVAAWRRAGTARAPAEPDPPGPTP
jgi:apolipoprotein N-acyltransferase